MQQLKSRLGGCDHGDETEHFVAGIVQAVHFSGMGNNDVSRLNGSGFTGFVDHVLALAGQDCPGILSGGVTMRLDALAGFEIPRDDNAVRRGGDNAANGLAIGRFKELRAGKDTPDGHARFY